MAPRRAAALLALALLALPAALAMPLPLPAPADDVPAADPTGLSADWPMYGHDLWGTHANPAEALISTLTASRLREVWRLDVGSVWGTPVESGGVLYAGTLGGEVVAADALTGHALWRTSVGGWVSASPAVADGLVFAVTLYPARLFALSAATGTVVWSQPVAPGASGWGSPVVANGLVLVGGSGGDDGLAGPTTRGSVQAFAAPTGTLVWRTYTVAEGRNGGAVWTTPAVLGAVVYVGTGNAFSLPADNNTDAMVAVDLAAGKVLWSHQFTPNDGGNPDWDFGASPQLFLADGAVVLGEAQKQMYHAVDPLTGASLWSRWFNTGWEIGTPAVADGTVVSAGGWCCSHAQAFSVRDGSTAWSRAGGDSLSAAAIAGGVAFLPEIGGTLHAVDLASGAELWTGHLPGYTFSGPAIALGHVYVGSGAGVTAYGLA